jgi:hypothetical protein
MDSNVIFPDLPTYVGVPSWQGLASLLISAGLPLIAALFMRAQWSGTTKGLVLLGFAAVKAFVEAWITSNDAHTAFALGPAAYSTIVQFALGVIAYFGALRNSSVQRSALAGGILRSKVIDGTTTGRPGTRRR